MPSNLNAVSNFFSLNHVQSPGLQLYIPSMLDIIPTQGFSLPLSGFRTLRFGRGGSLGAETARTALFGALLPATMLLVIIDGSITLSRELCRAKAHCHMSWRLFRAAEVSPSRPSSVPSLVYHFPLGHSKSCTRDKQHIACLYSFPWMLNQSLYTTRLM
jgi:hypothetical protein